MANLFERLLKKHYRNCYSSEKSSLEEFLEYNPEFRRPHEEIEQLKDEKDKELKRPEINSETYDVLATIENFARIDYKQRMAFRKCKEYLQKQAERFKEHCYIIRDYSQRRLIRKASFNYQTVLTFEDCELEEIIRRMAFIVATKLPDNISRKDENFLISNFLR